MTKRKETKEKFEARVLEAVAKAMRKSDDLVQAGRKERTEARKAAIAKQKETV
jgi:hypothetical protein